MANVVEGEPRNSQEWFGSYLDEDGIVADVLKRVQADQEAVKRWLDPVSWRVPNGWLGARRMPFSIVKEDPDHAGCLMFAPMSIRNFYGLWHASNPHTAFDIHDDVEITDGVITDKRHPDNMSFRIIDRVKKALGEQVTRELCHGNSDGSCLCQERMGNDFYFLPKGQCLFKKDAA
ncbi:hypothetical protein [Bradyrhizobium phage BDU-MI-1]|nr:hypothetical protein [Bradyrhizobium phage BDU-MI-1]